MLAEPLLYHELLVFPRMLHIQAFKAAGGKK